MGGGGGPVKMNFCTLCVKIRNFCALCVKVWNFCARCVKVRNFCALCKSLKLLNFKKFKLLHPACKLGKVPNFCTLSVKVPNFCTLCCKSSELLFFRIWAGKVSNKLFDPDEADGKVRNFYTTGEKVWNFYTTGEKVRNFCSRTEKVWTFELANMDLRKFLSDTYAGRRIPRYSRPTRPMVKISRTTTRRLFDVVICFYLSRCLLYL